MDLLTFAASRGDRLKQADSDLAPFVRAALASRDWDELIDAASVLWLETFQAEAPNADPDRFMPRFREMAGESLSKTAQEEPNEAQVHRVTYWLSTATVNNATYWGNAAHGGNAMRWHTMEDASVRETHRAADGQIASRDGTFDIGGFDLRYPGEPVGPPDIWISCRCLLVPARVEGAFDVTDAITADGTISVDDDENPDIVVSNNVTAAVDDEITDMAEPDDVADEPEDEEELITEIPVHGLIAPESVLSGDYRVFAEGALSNRNLPLPLRYEFVSSHGGDTSHVATVGRVDEVFMAEDGMRWRGVLVLSRQYTPEVIEGLTDRTVRGVSLDGDMGVVQVSDDGMPGAMSKDSPLVFDEVRVAGLTIVPIPAFQEAYIAFGHEFADELTEEQLVAAAQALEDCGCTEDFDGFDVIRAGGGIVIVDLTDLSEDELDAYHALDADGQDAFARENDLIIEWTPEFRDVSSEEREKLADEGKAMPDGSFPIANCDDLKNAIQAIGRASDPEAVRRHIIKRANQLDCGQHLPEDWAVSREAFDPKEIAAFEALPDSSGHVLEASPQLVRTALELGSVEAAIAKLDEAITASAFAPGTHDGPGWITHPVPTARIRRYWTKGKGAAKIRWGVPGDFNRCRLQLAKYVQNPDWLAGLCANMHKEAIGVWPGQEGGGHADSLLASGRPIMTLVAAGITPKPAMAFRDPGLTEPTTTTIEEIEGGYLRIFGHLAAWGVCHIGIQDTCTTAPHSGTNYAMFRTGTIVTDEGRVAVGQLTMGTGHAGLRANARSAVAHYDNTGTAVADVVVGEDAHGIWFSGIVRASATDEQIEALQASALSGDWRRNGTGLELVAALAVNVPGFPIPRTSLAASGEEGQESLVAAGIVSRETVDAIVSEVPMIPATEIAGIVRASVSEYIAEGKRAERAAALAPFAAKTRASALSRIAAKFGGND